MEPRDSYRIGDYRDGTAGRVPCPKCGSLIAEDATRCVECGVHFQRGTVYDFSPRGRRMGTRRSRRRKQLVVSAILAIIVALLLMIFR